ncbi:hypothetical protein GUITHDRAFT_114158 [Guillardia theta CCMP2712]|uniref:Uncharacterized protein n=1 Tax=Guillardia theta (strain CCMP2712) TaxID=905079 RepID=L1ITS1_GUITC|nr:hypothetical protein GUITHDRAFT_114158 [Guillardia theta CCMP2712]EKX39661.1 hypothetical protein GUITHDRAFT_114158 [Guillardia theta CCMP2712]|eukprot:XP_005826641.1 hypothetical protein GUITHDRAFT_114158 [Guillardia theta CCMP2712]
MFSYTPGKANAQTHSGLFAGGSMSDLDVALEQKLLEIDNSRKGERFASGQPRHWDLVAEMRPQDSSKLRLGRDSPTRSPPQKVRGAESRGALRFATSRTPEEGRQKRVTISYPEQDRDAQQSALAIERFLKSIGIGDIWIRGHSEAKLLDADPAFHNFQDLKHVQTCDLFLTVVNHAWQLDARCVQELELARKMHYTSLERNFTRPGHPRRPHIVALLLGVSESQLPELSNMTLVSKLTSAEELRNGQEVTSDFDSGLKSEDDEDWSVAALETFRELASIMLSADILSSSEHLSIETRLFGGSAEKSETSNMCEQAARAEKALADALASVSLLSQALAAVTDARGLNGSAAAAAAAAAATRKLERARGIDPPGASSMPFASMMSPRYLGTLVHTMGGRMVWSLDISFDNLVDPLQVEATVREKFNFFPNIANPDESTAYWTRWCNVRIGHQAVEMIKCNFDPVQGLIIAEGVQAGAHALLSSS